MNMTLRSVLLFAMGIGTMVSVSRASASATMRFMEHVHGTYGASQDERKAHHLYVSKRPSVEDRACRRLHKTPHLVLPRQWYFTGAELAEGFWSAEVAALSC